MNYLIRELKQDENKVLDTFLYEAIFIPEGVSAPPKDIINQPDLQVYVKDFGKNKGDLCLVAQVSDKIVGAVWVRIMNDYGHIDNETPSFAISLLNLTFGSCRSLYGAKKIFHSIVGNNGVAWVVRV